MQNQVFIQIKVKIKSWSNIRYKGILSQIIFFKFILLNYGILYNLKL